MIRLNFTGAYSHSGWLQGLQQSKTNGVLLLQLILFYHALKDTNDPYEEIPRVVEILARSGPRFLPQN